jgi:hypothetical protein
VWQQQRGWRQQSGWQEHRTWEQHRAQRWQFDHRTWVQRGGYGGYYDDGYYLFNRRHLCL